MHLNQSQFPGQARRTGLIAMVVCAIVFVQGCNDSEGAGDARNAHAEVERKAVDRMVGVRCVGSSATTADKADIARLLIVNTLAPRGSLPSWLPSSFVMPDGTGNGEEVWNRLAAKCPNAPTFGTPFGFPSGEIEKELRKDPQFSAVADGLWAEAKSLQHRSGSTTP